MKAKLKYLITGIIVLIAAVVIAFKYWDYVTNPWTRNGQVFAQVVQITSRVSGPVIKLPVVDNQFVKAGDLLFAAVNLVRHAGVDPERALRRGNCKFTRRFQQMETFMRDAGRSIADADLDTLDYYWEKAKQQEVSR